MDRRGSAGCACLGLYTLFWPPITPTSPSCLPAPAPPPRQIKQATCLQTMYDHLVTASSYVEEMKIAFKDVKEEHE